MLEGMAIEAWLKGLMCASRKRTSGPILSKVERLIDEKLVQSGHTDQVTVQQIFEAMEDPEIKQLFAEASLEDEELYRERTILIREYGSHDLQRMAESVAFEPELSAAAMRTLQFYSQMIELGRYPAPKKTRPLVKVLEPNALESGRSEVFASIFAKRNQLEFGH